MSNVTVSMKMSPKATGALYMKSLKQAERIAELEKELSLTKDIIVAHQIADETGYIDGVGWVENWSEMEEKVLNLLEAHNLDQHDKGIDSAIAELTICYRVALDEHKDYEDAEVLEGLIDRLQSLKEPGL